MLKELADSQCAMTARIALTIDDHEVFVLERDLNTPFDKAAATWNQHDGNANDPTVLARKFAVAADALRLLSAQSKEKPIDAILGSELGNFVDARDASLAKLEELYARFAHDLATYRKDTDEQRRRDEEELRTLRKNDQDALAADTRKKEELLAEREEALQKRMAEVDDRAALHARRELRKSILEKLEARNKEFTLTAGTRRLRWPVAVILALIAAFFGTLLAQSATASARLFADSQQWTVAMTYMAVKQAILTAAILSVVWYAVRWYNSWFREHADEEFKSKAMLLDIERASWVVETATDWRRANGTDIPDVLIDRLTQDLFTAKDSSPPPTPDLSSALIGASSKMRLKLGDQAEMELDRRGTKQLRKDLAKRT